MNKTLLKGTTNALAAGAHYPPASSSSTGMFAPLRVKSD